MFDAEVSKKLFNKSKKPMVAAAKYHTLLSEGLAENGVCVNLYSSIPVNKENCDAHYIRIPTSKSGNIIKQYIAVFNIPGIRHCQLFIKTFIKAILESKNTIVLYDPLVVASSYGAVLGAKCSRKKCVAIVTDLPQFMPISKRKKLLRVNEKLLDFANGYVFLTSHMDEAVNKKKKPFVVLEGHADNNMLRYEHKAFSNEVKKIMYAGSLRKIYGIADLCNAFVKCNFQNTELHIYGEGDFVPQLQNLVEKFPNIIFHGNCPNEEVVSMELDATLLVNPRPTDGEYTKYSFPSKTMEYMASGTPVLTSRLPGIPKEYDKYLFYFDDRTEGSLEVALKDIMNRNVDELREIGSKAREFVLKYKNNIVQSEKIVKFLEDNLYLLNN